MKLSVSLFFLFDDTSLIDVSNFSFVPCNSAFSSTELAALPGAGRNTECRITDYRRLFSFILLFSFLSLTDFKNSINFDLSFSVMSIGTMF